MASTEVEQQSQPLESNKRCVLRVSIHCEGCKRKVKKLLQSHPGVDDIEIEIKLQRVVVTGDVSPETLIRKLVKAGKHAQLWPQNPPPQNIPNQKPPTTTTTHPQESLLSNKEIKSPETKTEIPVADPSKTGGGGGKVDEGVAAKSEVTGGDGKTAVEVNLEEKKPDTGPPGNQASQAVAEKKEEKTDQSSGGGEGKKKKKKKKDQNIYKNSSNGETSTTVSPPPELGGSGNDGPPAATNQIPPRHHGYHQYPPPPPVYTVSYNTAHPPPVSSYTASYYATPPPQSYHAYSHYRTGMEPPPQPYHPPSDFDSFSQPQPQPLDSFEMFSDENPNGCLVM